MSLLCILLYFVYLNYFNIFLKQQQEKVLKSNMYSGTDDMLRYSKKSVYVTINADFILFSHFFCKYLENGNIKRYKNSSKEEENG